MSGWRLRIAAVGAGLSCVGIAACGSGARQDAAEPNRSFDVEVQQASFPRVQRLAQHARLVIRVRNADQATIPDIAVTIDNPRYGSSAQAFGYRISSPSLPELASASRAAWIVDQGPEPHGCQYSCKEGGPGGAVTAYSNTWALGPLKPGQTATFEWALTAVHPGRQVVRYRVAAGLNGKAKAVLAGGGIPEGTFAVAIRSVPTTSYVNDNGQVVNAP